MQLKELLKEMIDVKASDVFINAGLPLSYQASGVHKRMDSAPLTPRNRRSTSRASTSLPAATFPCSKGTSTTTTTSASRFQALAASAPTSSRQRGSYGAVIRVIPFSLPNPVEMNIPESVMDLANTNKGLGVGNRPAGGGKSTTLACLLDRMNHERTGAHHHHGRPHQYVHKHGTCIITQREIPPTSPRIPRRCARRCAKAPTLSFWARCAMPTPSARR